MVQNIYKELIKLGYDCRNIQGSDTPEKKEKDLLGFAHNEYQIMISKYTLRMRNLRVKCLQQVLATIIF